MRSRFLPRTPRAFRSTRHKSGVAMRFPRVNRIRWDKPAREADELATLEKLLD
jgi:DNA ligase-1